MILHIMILDKFLPPFIDFVDKHFGRGEHKYVFITSEKYQYGLTPGHGAEFLHTDEDLNVTLTGYMDRAERILLHGLWRDKVNELLVRQPELLKKAFWVMWGGEFYYPQRCNENQRYVMTHIAYMINVLDEEIAMVRTLYGATGKHLRSYFYSTNLFHINRDFCQGDGPVRILMGHSTAKDIRHLDYLPKIAAKDDGSFEVLCPLSYPKTDLSYIEQIVMTGQQLFGGRFYPLQDFIPLEHYRSWLSKINFAVFSSSRQHGMSNMVDLLGHGCKLFLDPTVSTWTFFNRIGVEIYSVHELDFSPIQTQSANNNAKRIRAYFSETRLKRDLSDIFSVTLGQDIQLEEI